MRSKCPTRFDRSLSQWDREVVSGGAVSPAKAIHLDGMRDRLSSLAIVTSSTDKRFPNRSKLSTAFLTQTRLLNKSLKQWLVIVRMQGQCPRPFCVDVAFGKDTSPSLVALLEAKNIRFPWQKHTIKAVSDQS